MLHDFLFFTIFHPYHKQKIKIGRNRKGDTEIGTKKYKYFPFCHDCNFSLICRERDQRLARTLAFHQYSFPLQQHPKKLPKKRFASLRLDRKPRPYLHKRLRYFSKLQNLPGSQVVGDRVQEIVQIT